MNILGINAFGENPSACIVIDGKLLNFCAEERFNRLKNSNSLFPSHSISWCLRNNGLVLQDIDKIAYYWGCHKYPQKMFFELSNIKFKLLFKKKYKYKSSINATNHFFDAIEQLTKFSPGNIEKKIRDNLRYFGHKGPIPKIEFVDHHIAHAYQTFYQSPFTESAILIVDGHGEEDAITGYKMKNGILKKEFGYKIPFSLGWFYSAFTAYLGFLPNRDEGKVMGLAAYGESRKSNNPWIERISKILKVTNTGFELNPLFLKFGNNEYNPRYTDSLVKYITSFDPELTPISYGETFEKNGQIFMKYLQKKYIDLAFAVQTQIEKALAVLANQLWYKTSQKNICLAGGVAMNCKANSYIFDNTNFENIFIHPASSDDGSCIGAAFFIAKEFDKSFNENKNILNHVQIGPSYSNDQVEKALKSCNINYRKPSDICSVTAKLLSEGKFISWFQGGCEMGARALGGRSIVACPQNPEVKNLINARVKFREIWRPYCPSILSEYKDDYLKEAVETPFMILAREAKPALQKNAPSVVHVDNTVRPQTVEKHTLPKWYELIDNVGKITGHPIVLNTSFNVRGEPIVCSPYDAIRTFYSTGLDYLVIQDYLISK